MGNQFFREKFEAADPRVVLSVLFLGLPILASGVIDFFNKWGTGKADCIMGCLGTVELLVTIWEVTKAGGRGSKLSLLMVICGLVGAGISLSTLGSTEFAQKRGVRQFETTTTVSDTVTSTPNRQTVTTIAAGNAARLLEYADNYRRVNVEDYKGQVKRYQIIITKHFRTSQASKARNAIKEIEIRWDEAAEIELAKLRDKAADLIKDNKYGDAMRVVDSFPIRLRNARWHLKAYWLKDEYAEAAKKAFDQIKEQADKLIVEGDYQGANQAYQKAAAFGLPIIAKQAKKATDDVGRKKEYRQLLKQAKEATNDVDWKKEATDEVDWKKEYAATEAYRCLQRQFLPLLASRYYRKAWGVVARALLDNGNKFVAGRLAEDKADIRCLGVFWSAVRQGAKKLKCGEMFSVNGMRGKFVKYEKGNIVVSMCGSQISKSLRDLAAAEIIKLAAKVLDRSASDTNVMLALFHMYNRKRDINAARVELKKAKGKGIDTDRLLTICNRLGNFDK